MSWSIDKTGRAEALKNLVAEEKAKTLCCEPEETIRKCACELILAALNGQTDQHSLITIEAFGSQAHRYLEDGFIDSKYVSNSFSIRLTPIANVLEVYPIADEPKAQEHPADATGDSTGTEDSK